MDKYHLICVYVSLRQLLLMKMSGSIAVHTAVSVAEIEGALGPHSIHLI